MASDPKRTVGQWFTEAKRILIDEGDWRKASKFSERPFGWKLAYIVGGGLMFAALLRFWVFNQIIAP